MEVQKKEIPMTGKQKLTGLVLVIAGALVGCDQSKAELDKTKADLVTVTAERDSLKTQLDQANGRLAGLQQQVTDLQAKVAASATAAAPPPADDKPDAKGAKHAAKKGPAKAGAASPAPPPSAEKMKELQKAPEARSGRGHL
jgi:chromosome segregation ATPase